MRTVHIHQSLHRHAHVLGAERTLVLSSGLLAFLVGLGGMTFLSAACAAAFWVPSIFVLRNMAKADPQLSTVWLRHVKQQIFYPARAGRWALPGRVWK